MEKQLLEWSQDELLKQIITSAAEKQILDDEEKLEKLYALIKFVKDFRRTQINVSKAKGSSSPMDNYYYRKMLI